MKGTEHFKQAIKSYLDERAKTDELFAVAYAKENKNLDDCVTFILNQVKALANEGCVGMADNFIQSSTISKHTRIIFCKTLILYVVFVVLLIANF